MSKGDYADFRDFYENDSNFTPEERAGIEFCVELISVTIEVRDAEKEVPSHLRSQVNANWRKIVRIANGKSSPRVDTLLKHLVPLGYTLKIVQVEKTASDTTRVHREFQQEV